MDSYKRYKSFEAVITNMRDQVLMRKLLMKHVSEDAKEKVVEEFNDKLKQRYEDN